MDSFDIMNPNMDSMLTPGELFRKTFDTALMGLESKGGGGGQSGGGVDPEIADLNHEQNMNNYNYAWDRAQDQYKHQLLQNEIQRRDLLAQNQWQEANQEQQWMYANAVKEQEYNSQMAAFNKSEKMYGWQVKMNQISADMALDDQAAQTDERYQALHFESLDASKQYSSKKTELAMQGLGADLDIYSKRTASQRSKQKLTIDQQTKRGEAAAQDIEESVKAMQVMGQVKAKGQAGGSAAKQYQAIAAQTSRLEAAKAYNATRSDFAMRLALNGVDQTMAEQEAAANLANVKIGQAGFDNEINKALGIEKREATKLSIGSAHERANRKIEHDQYVANVQADMNRMSEPSRGVPIPKPLEIPMATIMDPILPVKGKPPVWGAGAPPELPQQKSGGWGQIIGMAAGIAATAMIPGFGLFSTGGMALMGMGTTIGGFTESML